MSLGFVAVMYVCDMILVVGNNLGVCYPSSLAGALNIESHLPLLPESALLSS
jgi:hypothetical protein